MLWNTATGKQLARLIAFDRGSESLVLTPENFFTATDGALNFIQWKKQSGALVAEEDRQRLIEYYHRPDLVEKALKGQPIEK